MYRLRKLELLGFKSFADRTRLEFSDGVAAVVGPNGCGKSNIVDSITWVLGEQSARMLRGERMADVIFNGTGSRPPLSMAEVSLTLVDPEYQQAEPVIPSQGNGDASDVIIEGSLGEASGGNGNGKAAKSRNASSNLRNGEVTVTRRLFRSGESEYLINGDVCRLRDIQDLFLGTGLGPESYAIIEQGRIGQILSSKPSDRRAILEEAAGVSKFKTRKRLAEAKLESSRQNLSRIADILEEVVKQVNSLKRQASKARRYREFQEELRQRLRIVLGSKLLALDKECERFRQELTEIEAECSKAATLVEELDREQKDAVLRHEEIQDRLTRLREEIAQGDLQRQRFQSGLEQAKQRITGLESRVTDASQDSQIAAAQLNSLKQEAEERSRRQLDLQEELSRAREAAAQLAMRQEALASEIAQVENRVDGARQAALTAVSQTAELRNQMVQTEEFGLALDRQAARAETERSSVEEEHKVLAASLDASRAEQQQQHEALTQLQQAVTETAHALEEARAEENGYREQLATLRQEFSRAEARKQTLEESLAQHSYTTDSVRRLLSGEIGTHGGSFRPLGVLADFIEVSSGYEEVVEEFLQSELNCIVVERHDEARSGIELLRNEGTGRSTFFVTQIPSLAGPNGHNHAEVLREPGVVARLRELVQFEPRLGLNGSSPLPAIEYAYLVEDSRAAEQLAGKYEKCHFLTRAGEHYHHRLVSGGKGPRSGPLAMRRDFRELERRVSDLQCDISKAETALADCVRTVARLQEELGKLTEAKLEAEKKAMLAAEKLRQSEERSHQSAERLRILRGEFDALEEERKAVRERRDSLRTQLGEAEKEQSRHEQEMELSANRLRELRGQADRLAPEIAEAQARASALEERAAAMEAERSRLLAQAAEATERIDRLQKMMTDWREEQARSAQETESLHARLAELETQQRIAREEQHTLEADSGDVRAKRDQLTGLVEAARTQFDALREQRTQAEIAKARAESDHDHQVQQCRSELSLEPTQLITELAPETTLAGESLHVAETELGELKSRLENLGPVNMMALEELQEAEDRYTFLETQRQDLLASIEDTSQAIREIDRISRQKFLEAFKAINEYFAQSFRTLFGGGVGQMRLADEADPDSGLDIVTQPPGKRLQNVLLLSGGEKALAALALLIAIFRYTPSPFCVLDEVDAPLDESNIDRFTRMIQQMSQTTQFILITHNKRTMEIGKVMYGVTMEDPGVSKLVSVRFEEVPESADLVPVAG